MAKNKIFMVALSVMLLGTALLGACTKEEENSPTPTYNVRILGSTTVQPLAEVLAEKFMDANKYENGKNKYNVTVGGGGSGVGVSSAKDGTADLGSISRELSVNEAADGLSAYVIAIDGIAIIVNPGNNVSNLTKDQIKDIFAGNITNWNQVGGANQSITVVTRESGSGTLDAFNGLVMNGTQITSGAIIQGSNGSVKTSVINTTGAIGYISLGMVDNTVKALSVDGVAATVANVKNDTYKLWRNLYLVSKGVPNDAASDFLNFIRSSAGQQIVVDEGYISIL